MFLLMFVPTLKCQDAPSLGDIARRARAEKNHVPAVPAKQGGAATSTLRPAIAETKPAAAGSSARSDAEVLGDLNLHFVDHYEDTVRTLFEQDKFEQLDGMASTARSTKARLPGGYWTIHIIYHALLLPRNGTYKSTDADFDALIDRLKKWVAQRPTSITARVALAGAYVQYGEHARGGGYANTVTEDGWRLQAERSSIAGKILAEAFDLPEKCPEWYLQMQSVISTQDSGREMERAMFEKAVAFEPTYQYYYRILANKLLPKWGGEKGEMAAFAAKAADRLGGADGDVIYYDVGSFINCACDNSRGLNGMSWDRIKAGYAEVEKRYGSALTNLNKMAALAALADDGEYAAKAFEVIGKNWDVKTWQTQKRFDDAREWATDRAEVMKIETALKVTESNAATAKGHQFESTIENAFAQQYPTAAGECLKGSGEPFIIPFDLLMQISANGTVEKAYGTIRSGVSACMITRVQTAKFPVPPTPSYWVKVHLQPSVEDLRKLQEASKQGH
jgi:hypothetical protein